MKKHKLSIILFLIIVTFSLAACAQKKEEQVEDDIISYDTLSATNLVNNYLRYLKNNDFESIKKICTEDMLRESEIQGKSNLNVISYKIDEVLELNSYAIFKVKVVSVSSKGPYALLQEYRINVIKGDDGYKVSDIKTSVDKEVFIKEDEIRMRNKNDIHTNVVIYMEDVPNFITSKQDKMKMHKYSVPKKNFEKIGISYDGLTVAVSTYDKDSYVALINIDESLAMQASKQQGGNDKNTEQDQGKKADGVKEIPIGKQIFSLDLLNDSKIDFMVFSPEQNFLVVQYKNDKQFKCIRVYDTKKMELIPVSFEESFPLDKVDVTFHSFEKDLLYFEVEAKKDISFDQKDIIGKYKLNFENFKINKN